MCIVSMSFATSYDDEWPIYVYGDASYYKLIFDAIAMIVQNSSFMDPALKFVATASTIFIGRGFYKQNTSDVLWNTAAGIGFITMLLYPSSTVHVLDVRTLHGYVQEDLSGANAGDYSGYQKIDHIPFYIAATASFATSIKYYIIDVSTDALSPIDGGSFRDSGFATPMRLSEDMISTASFKYSKDNAYTVPLFGQALSHYVEKCIIENALYIDQTQIHKVRDPKMNQIEALDPANFPDFATTTITDLRGQPVTCTAFWNSNIATKINTVKTEMQDNLQLKHRNINLTTMAQSMTFVAGLDSDAAVALSNMQNAMLNVATTAVTMNAFSKAGAGLSGIDLSNEMTAQQSLFANMTDSTGQFKWMIRVVPVLEFLIFGILLFLAIPMAFVAGISGAEKGGKMLMNYSFGLIAFSFIDVALAIVQAISLYYYKNKMADVVIALGDYPFTASGITPYIQEMGYMSGMMGLAAVIVVPITVGVVFKGETAAAMGAYNSVMGKYKGDQGGQTALDSERRAAAVHTSEAQQMEDAARRELAGGYGITTIPKGVLASQYLDQISAEAAALSGSGGAMRMMDSEYGGDYQKFAQARARAGMGSGMQKLGSEIGSGNGVLDAINGNPSSMSDFMYQAGSSAAAGFMSQAKQGALSQSNPLLSRENQIEAAMGSAESDLRKSVATGLGASKAFKDGVGDDFSYQTQTDSEAGINAQAKKGALSQSNPALSRDTQVLAAMGSAKADLAKGVASGLASESSLTPETLSNFMHQTFTDTAAGLEATAAKGKLSQDKEDYSRQKQIEAAKVMANDSLVKSVKNAEGLKESMGFDKDGNIDNLTEFSKYAEGIVTQSRMQANKTMGAGVWASTKDEQQMIDAMSDIQRASAAGMASEVAKGDALQKSKYGIGLDGKGLSKYESDTTDIEQSKSDNMLGQAKGVRANYAKNKDIYSQNAEFGEESKQQSTDTKIKAQGGIAGAVAVDVADAFIKANQQSGSTKGMMKVADNIKGQQEFVNKTLAGAKDEEHRSQMLKDFENSGWTDATGKVQEGAFIKARAMLGANNMMSSNSMGIGGSIVSGTIGATSDNTTVKVDGVDSSASGKKRTFDNDVVQVNNTDAKTRNQLENTNNNVQETASRLTTRDRVEYEANLKNQALDAATHVIHKVTPEGSEEKAVDIAAVVGTTIAGGVATYSAYGLDKKYNPELDEDGKKTGRGAWGGKVIDAGLGVRDSVLGEASSSPISQQTTNKSDNRQPNESHSNKDKDGTHDKSFNSDKDNISNNSKSVKDQVGEQYKKEQVLNQDPDFKRDMDALKEAQAKQKALNPDNPNVESRHNAEKVAMEDAHYQRINEANMGTPKGFFGKRMEAFSEAMHGGGSWKTKMGMMASAIVLGEASATAGEIMQAADPTSFFTGTEAGSSAFGGDELKQMMAAQHQGFSTQPSGFHTMQAISADTQQQAAQAQISMANNIQALSSIAPNRSYVGLSMTDADQNPVSFTTDKASRNMMINGNNTGMPAQQFGAMMQNPDSVSQFANAISQTSFANVEAYNATNNILSEMNAQTQRANMQQKIHNNSSDTRNAMQHKESLEANSQKSTEEYEI